MRRIKQTFKIELLQNLFAFYEKELINIASDQVVPSEIKDDILTAHKKGCNISNQFVQRLIWKQVEFNAPFKTMTIKTFIYLQKKHPYQKGMKETDCVKADKYFLSIVARTQKVDLGEILTHCLSQFPSSLSNIDCSLQHTSKAALFLYLQVKFPDMKIIKIPQKTALILDGMAII